MMDYLSEIGGVVGAAASSVIALPAGALRGAYDVVTGKGTFMEGADDTAGRIMEVGEGLGRELVPPVVEGLARGAANEYGRQAARGRNRT